MRPHARKSQSNKRAHQKEDDDDVADDSEQSFESPERDGNTDYGLDFTSSRLSQINLSPRRCSTLRKKSPTKHQKETTSSSSEDDDESDEENQPPAPLLSRNVSQTNRTRTDDSRKTAQPKQTTTKHRRKQTIPESRARKMTREIIRLQATDKFLIPRLPISRLVREIIQSNSAYVSMITTSALEAIHTSAEMYLTQRFQDAYLLTQYRGRVTLEVRDMAMVAYFCKNYGGFWDYIYIVLAVICLPRYNQTYYCTVMDFCYVIFVIQIRKNIKPSYTFLCSIEI